MNLLLTLKAAIVLLLYASSLWQNVNAQDQHHVDRQKVKEEVSRSGKYLPANQGKKSDKNGEHAENPRGKESIFKNLGGGKYQIGKVILDKKKRSVHVPAQVNMTKGIVEYILVADSGKVHESVFTTTAKPSEIHLAFLLLGCKGIPLENWPKDYLQVDEANQVAVEITWKSNGPKKNLPATQCVQRTDSANVGAGRGSGMASGSWLYSGSYLNGDSFVADREGSIIAIIADEAALVNGLRPHNQDDTLYAANEKDLPNKGFQVEVVFRLPKLK